jgi:hypothetical protein
MGSYLIVAEFVVTETRHGKPGVRRELRIISGLVTHSETSNSSIPSHIRTICPV